MTLINTTSCPKPTNYCWFHEAIVPFEGTYVDADRDRVCDVDLVTRNNRTKNTRNVPNKLLYVTTNYHCSKLRNINETFTQDPS